MGRIWWLIARFLTWVGGNDVPWNRSCEQSSLRGSNTTWDIFGIPAAVLYVCLEPLVRTGLEEGVTCIPTGSRGVLRATCLSLFLPFNSPVGKFWHQAASCYLPFLFYQRSLKRALGFGFFSLTVIEWLVLLLGGLGPMQFSPVSHRPFSEVMYVLCSFSTHSYHIKVSSPKCVIQMGKHTQMWLVVGIFLQ